MLMGRGLKTADAQKEKRPESMGSRAFKRRSAEMTI